MDWRCWRGGRRWRLLVLVVVLRVVVVLVVLVRLVVVQARRGDQAVPVSVVVRSVAVVSAGWRSHTATR